MTVLLTPTPSGLYCTTGDFYIDPWKPVPRAVVTHAHADHYAWGCGAYLVAAEGERVFRVRLGAEARIRSQPYGASVTLNGVKVSFHPAGHILGSAQVRVEYQGEVWVVSGDYKNEADRTCTPFEVVPCHHFISEATFALPIYQWRPQSEIFADMNQWWAGNAAEGKATILYCYALGKAQRVLAGVDPSIGPILTHGAVEQMNQAYRAGGIDLPPTTYAMTAAKQDYRGALIIAPVSARDTAWVRRFGTHATGYTSGWMRIRGTRRRRAVDRGFILSDHADWDNLLATIHATGAERIGVTHGYVPVLTRYLQEQGMDAYGLETRYGGEVDDSTEGGTTESGTQDAESGNVL
jgi:putative mRNA 3-end processing factor